jgi:ferredoxin--NADP+ reductase
MTLISGCIHYREGFTPMSSSTTPPLAQAATVPSNVYKLQAPLACEVLENRRLTHPDSPNDVRHLVLNLEGSDYRYVEGQSVGILPPGLAADGKAHKLRLYSIASAAIGDDRNGKTLTICVKRATTQDPVTGEVFKGVCSNYLCDLAPGATVQATGPVGKAFLLPESKDFSLVMVATGTGIAPFRGFLDWCYTQGNNAQQSHWLLFGAQTRKDFLYESELQTLQARHPQFNLVTAFSREEQTAAGQRMYVQHRIQEHAVTLLKQLQQPNAYFYICGLKGMETGILEAFEQAATANGLVWDDLLARMKAEKRWHVEVY